MQNATFEWRFFLLSFYLFVRYILSRMDCFGRTNFCAGTTVGTNVRINHIDITFRNSFNRIIHKISYKDT